MIDPDEQTLNAVKKFVLRARLRFLIWALLFGVGARFTLFAGFPFSYIGSLVLVLLGLALLFSLWLTFQVHSKIQWGLESLIGEMRVMKPPRHELKKLHFLFTPMTYLLCGIPLFFLAFALFINPSDPALKYIICVTTSLSGLYVIYIHDSGRFKLDGTVLVRSPWLMFWYRRRLDLREIRGYRTREPSNPWAVPVRYLELYDAYMERRLRIVLDVSNASALEIWANENLLNLNRLNQYRSLQGLFHLWRN